MAVQVKTKEDLNKEIQENTNRIAVLDSKIESLSKELGIEPTIEAIEAKLKEVSEKKESLEQEIGNLLKEIEKIELGDNDSTETKPQGSKMETSKESVKENPKGYSDNDDFE